MRKVKVINDNWYFSKKIKSAPTSVPSDCERLTLPYTWNGEDGQDGGNDYYRGLCWYVKTLSREDIPQGERLFLELGGANSSADLYVNGAHVAHHDGGYSAWRADVTDALGESGDALIAIGVDNSPNETVYPQMADFTFYGGLYRDVNLIAVPASHFDLTYFGGPGIAVTPVMEGDDARVTTHVYLTDAKPSQTLRYVLRDGEGRDVAHAELPAETTQWEVVLPGAHRWHGRKDPYLYTAEVTLVEGDVGLDRVRARFGCRAFAIDPQKGFFLNGQSYPLHGVSRHQDRWGVGNALLPEHHREDMDLICELGANTIRLAHYQHDQLFYDLCDERGMVVWAEIPYISRHMNSADENAIAQMKELITQNYNHPSIVVWGLSNEITMNMTDEADMLRVHHALNDLCHELDSTRLTTLAAVSPCPIDAPVVHIPDVVSYNHYFGWYGGDPSMNGPWFDLFHKAYPDTPIGMSEYGCEALDWHTSDPRQGDYTEEYQAHYHEELIRQLFTRPYIWATHVWNMFDFGADARNEGGENGQNHKGLVTFDRAYKKDAFYAYKAWLSDEPFVHLCGKRYVDRVEDVTRVTVYSNLPEVTLLVNGEALATKAAPDHFFYFDVPNRGTSRLTAIAGDCRDESVIRKVAAFNESYRLREKGAVLNWFDVTEPEGRFSLNDRIGEIAATAQGKAIIDGLLTRVSGGAAAGFAISDGMREMMNGFSVLRMINLMGTAGLSMNREELLALNAQLNQIKKP